MRIALLFLVSALLTPTAQAAKQCDDLARANQNLVGLVASLQAGGAPIDVAQLAAGAGSLRENGRALAEDASVAPEDRLLGEELAQAGERLQEALTGDDINAWIAAYSDLIPVLDQLGIRCQIEAGGKAAADRLSAAGIQKILIAHNDARQEVGVAPLAWSGEVAAHAQSRADELAADGCKLQHGQATPYGENLAQGTGSFDASQLWLLEKSLYRGGPIDMNAFESGHYTQMVWRGTKRIGCGQARCGGGSLVVCNYDPPGNTVGERPY